jgi:diguanylate cyclase (GGDEF)-like protein
MNFNAQETYRPAIPSSNFWSRAWSFVLRHRVSIQDLGLLLAIILVLTYVAFEVDVFTTEGSVTIAQETIELDEALLLGGILAVGLLIFAARRYFAQKQEMMRRIAAEGQARELAYQDPLTGLANRRQFQEALDRAAASPPKAGACHAVLLLDLNGFKQINDTHGHGTGDEVLIIVAQRLLRAARDGDLVARLGGDEFVVLAQHLLGPEAASSIALRIIHALAEPILAGSNRHEIGAGIGIALLPSDAQNAMEAIRKADVALYRAKAERRSAFRFFEEDMDRFVRERDQMERALRKAIEEDLIQLRFRPSFNLRTGAVVGFEAIPSWTSPEAGDIPPERFLPIAEEAGLIHELARRLLERACQAAREWPAGVTLSIDILSGQLQDRELWRTILAVLSASGLEPDRLEIEVTESMIVHDLEAAKAALGPLREAGVRIALDNFGTGYSNLYHMQEFKLDRVKIDRRFVENVEKGQADRMIKALAGLGHGLGLSVSAEGIQGPVGNSSLLNSGVDEGQSSGDLVTSEGTRRYFETVPSA